MKGKAILLTVKGEELVVLDSLRVVGVYLGEKFLNLFLLELWAQPHHHLRKISERQVTFVVVVHQLKHLKHSGFLFREAVAHLLEGIFDFLVCQQRRRCCLFATFEGLTCCIKHV